MRIFQVASVVVALCAVAFSGAATFAFAFKVAEPRIAQYSEHMLLSAQSPHGLRVTFLGVATILFDDGETAILTDGFFTRPRKWAVVTQKVAPDSKIIEQSLARAGIKKLAAVVVTHSHYDHVMDVAEVAKRTGALVIGSESTANVARGGGLSEDRIRVIHGPESLNVGTFQVSFISTQHGPSPFAKGNVTKPLVPPARVFDYRDGGSYSVIVKNHDKALLVQGSAGFLPGGLRNQKADVVFLGIGGFGNQKDSLKETYWTEVVKAVDAKRVIPIHWDDFSRPLSLPLIPVARPFDDFDRTMAFLIERGRKEKVDVKFAPEWSKVDPFDGLQ